MPDLADIIIPEAERQRQAVASIRGYVYQIIASAIAWSALAEDEVLLLEVADDFSVVTSEALTLTQVKDVASGPATTLRTTGVVDTINAFWRLRNANRARRVRAVYMTTATFGRERGSSLPAPIRGLDEWRLAALEGRDLAGLKALLLALPLDPDLQLWLEQQPDPVIREELLRPMRWEGGHLLARIGRQVCVVHCIEHGVEPAFSAVMNGGGSPLRQDHGHCRPALILPDDLSLQYGSAELALSGIVHSGVEAARILDPASLADDHRLVA